MTNNTWELIIIIPLFLIGFLVSISDIRRMIIPNKLIYPGILIIGILRLFHHPQGFSYYVIGSVLASGILLIIALLYPKGMGMGDVKLFFLMGLGLGWVPVIESLFLSSLLGFLFGLILIVIGKRKKGEPIPFGPFIVLASIFSTIWGNSILSIIYLT